MGCRLHLHLQGRRPPTRAPPEPTDPRIAPQERALRLGWVQKGRGCALRKAVSELRSQGQAKTVGPVRIHEASARGGGLFQAEGSSAQAPGQEQLGGLRARKEAGLERSERGLREVTLGWAGATNIGLGTLVRWQVSGLNPK